MGFEDELQNFTLGLTNPSKQADLLMIDVWKEKVLLYKDLVAEIPKSIQATSATWAKKHIFGFSDEEIKLELQQVRMERAVSAELDNTATIITKTGLFDTVDRLYKAPASGTTAPAAGGDAGGAPDMGAPAPEAGGPPAPPEAAPTVPESTLSNKLNILTENKEDEYLSFDKMNNSLGAMENELSKLLRD